jgi:hypothetical protein
MTEADDEKLISISQIFDSANKWVGYEYQALVNNNHTRTSVYDSAGKLLTIRHVFNDPPNSRRVKDFISYMDQTKSISYIYNANYITEMSARPIDTASTIDEAKEYRDSTSG